jgi:hypothetical protein
MIMSVMIDVHLRKGIANIAVPVSMLYDSPVSRGVIRNIQGVHCVFVLYDVM